MSTCCRIRCQIKAARSPYRPSQSRRQRTLRGFHSADAWQILLNFIGRDAATKRPWNAIGIVAIRPVFSQQKNRRELGGSSKTFSSELAASL